MDSLKKTQPENGEYQTVSRIKQILERGDAVKKLEKYNNATVSIIYSFQINVSEYSWDHFSNEFYLQSG